MTHPTTAMEAWQAAKAAHEGCAVQSFGADDQAAAAVLEAWASERERDRPAETYAEWQQKRGMLEDRVDWAINEYDEFMKDDAYDAQAVLDRIIARLRDARTLLAGERGA